MLVGGNLLPLSDILTHALDCDEQPSVVVGGIRSSALNGGGGGQSSGGAAPPRPAAAAVPDEHWHWAFSELQLDPEQVSARVCEGRGCLLQGARPLGARVSPLPPPPPLTCALTEARAAEGSAFSVVGAHCRPPRAHRGAAAAGGRRAGRRPLLARLAPRQLPRRLSPVQPPPPSSRHPTRLQTRPRPPQCAATDDIGERAALMEAAEAEQTAMQVGPARAQRPNRVARCTQPCRRAGLPPRP
jgi:hypothetical protein